MNIPGEYDLGIFSRSRDNGFDLMRRQVLGFIHDEYRPTGYERTYPNLMTQEGIRGDEESPSTEHTLITLFTRMIAGAGDNTNSGHRLVRFTLNFIIVALRFY